MLFRGNSLSKIMFASRNNFNRILTHLKSLAKCLEDNYSEKVPLVYPNSKRCSDFWKGQKSSWNEEALAKFQAASIFSTDKFASTVFHNGCDGGMLQQVLTYIATKKNEKAIDVFRSKSKANNGLYADLKAKSGSI